MATVVTVAQQKGGAGKTSVAAHLSICLAFEGGADAPRPRVKLIDLDPQQSLTTWFRLREELYGSDEHLSLMPVTAGWRIAKEVEKARDEADIVIIDSPPHAQDAMRTGIRAADLVVVPLQLSPMDIWAARPTFDMIAKEQRKALFVFNRVPQRARAAEAIAEALKREQLPIANAALGNRVVYSSSLMKGQGVSEAEPRSTAADEIRALAAEVMRRLQ